MEGAGGAAGTVYAWAIENPGKVSLHLCREPHLQSPMTKEPLLDNLAPLAKAGVPLLHVCGSLDPSLNDQTRVVEKRYKDLGGKITVIIKEGDGHYPLRRQGPQGGGRFHFGEHARNGTFLRHSKWKRPPHRTPKPQLLS